MPKNAQTITQLHSSHTQVMLRILQARLQKKIKIKKYVNRELPDVQAGFRKGRGTRYQTASVHWIMRKARGFQKKTSTSASLTTLKPLIVEDHNKL